MKLLLIAPASGPWRQIGKRWLFNGKTFRFSMLSLLSVAAETPTDVEVTLIDEQIDAIPWQKDFDLIGITCMTALAPRAYQIADHFRQRGIPVILGGMHPTFCPDEALEHADAVLKGEAESVWPRVIADVRNGKLQSIYQSEKPCDLTQLKPVPRHLLKDSRYGTIYAVQATRGCTRRCRFCSVTAFHGNAIRCRPVEAIIHEIKQIPTRFFMLVDDNLTADPEYAHQLFTELSPLKKHWVSQASLCTAENEELVRAAAEAGCVGLFVGMESFSPQSLASSDKGFNQTGKYRESIEMLHRHGIGVEAGIVFGFDEDTPEVFDSTLSQLEDLEIDAVQFSIRTPFPGTPAFEEMKSRIIDRNWEHYDMHHVVFTPSQMPPKLLKSGHDWITHEFYRPWRIARRLSRWMHRPRGMETLRYAAGINLAYFGRTLRWNLQGANPAEKLRRPIVSPLVVHS